ncbi:CLUMA_CG010205, isoform A [Clunio marinus]|uniref:CLUMA_CG010205, isoform A n=1 Tax=Clunio marinus TaxID=568069 RepID=A0A1J1I978_9DIPT|nr:CLUMA_CG010205, isoform A [Clunio marinus]
MFNIDYRDHIQCTSKTMKSHASVWGKETYHSRRDFKESKRFLYKLLLAYALIIKSRERKNKVGNNLGHDEKNKINDIMSLRLLSAHILDYVVKIIVKKVAREKRRSNRSYHKKKKKNKG